MGHRGWLRVRVNYTHTCTCNGSPPHETECTACGERDCPGDEPLHYHHDGCPHCDAPGSRHDNEGDVEYLNVCY